MNKKKIKEMISLHNAMGSKQQSKWTHFLNKHFSGSSISYKALIAIIIPIFIDQSFIVVMSIINTAMISYSGVAAVSAVSMVDTLNFFLSNIFVAIATGGTVIVAQYKGRGDRQLVQSAAAQSISIVVIISIILTVIVLLFQNPLMNLLFGKAEEAVLQNAKLYLLGSCISFPLYAAYQGIVGVLRGIADTKACLILSLFMNMLFLTLNIILITGFSMGIKGLIISLIVSRFCGVLFALYYVLKINHYFTIKITSFFKQNFSMIKRIMFIGFPFALEQMFFNGGKLLSLTFIVQLGTAAITVNAIAGSLSMFTQITGSSLSIAIVTIVGQCVGSGNIKDARKFIKSLLGLSTVLFVVIGALCVIFLPFLIGIYHPPAEFVKPIYHLMLLTIIAQPLFWSLSFMLPAALRAAGDSKFTSVMSLLTMWILRISLGYVLGIVLDYGLMGVWIAMIVEWGVRGLIFGLRFRGDKWYRHKVI